MNVYLLCVAVVRRLNDRLICTLLSLERIAHHHGRCLLVRMIIVFWETIEDLSHSDVLPHPTVFKVILAIKTTLIGTLSDHDHRLRRHVHRVVGSCAHIVVSRVDRRRSTLALIVVL